jgi:hypothetical protein
LVEFTKRQCVALRDRVQQWSDTQQVNFQRKIDFQFSSTNNNTKKKKKKILFFQKVADVFVESAEMWSDLYGAYVQNYLNAMRQMRDLQRSNRQFGAFVAEQRRIGGDRCEPPHRIC